MDKNTFHKCKLSSTKKLSLFGNKMYREMSCDICGNTKRIVDKVATKQFINCINASNSLFNAGISANSNFINLEYDNDLRKKLLMQLNIIRSSVDKIQLLLNQ